MTADFNLVNHNLFRSTTDGNQERNKSNLTKPNQIKLLVSLRTVGQYTAQAYFKGTVFPLTLVQYLSDTLRSSISTQVCQETSPREIYDVPIYTSIERISYVANLKSDYPLMSRAQISYKQTKE